VHDAAGGDHQAVAALLDALAAADHTMPRLFDAVDRHGHHLPQAAQVGRAVDQRFGAARQHRCGHLAAPPALGCVGHGDVVGPH